MFHLASRAALPAVVGLAAALALTGCGATGGQGADGDRLSVTASFYPLQFVTERVGGERVEVSNLTKPGADPHDVELTPRDVARLGEADLVVYLHGFQPAVDDAIDAEAADTGLDVEPSARLGLGTPSEAGGDEHATEDHEHGAVDPHFWLDPTRLADVADTVAGRLAELDAAHATDYLANAESLRGDLEALDAELAAGLESCASRELVTSHTAFAYLADRYGLHEVGISGLSPEVEPSPQNLAAVSRFVNEHQVRTIYYETLVDPGVAQTVADETGAATAVLDPLEGLTDSSAGSDYFEVMRANLATLQQGQSCS